MDAQHARGNESLVSLSFFDHHRKGSTIVSAVVVYPVSRTSIDSSSNSLSSVVVSLDDPKSSHTPPSSLTSFDLLAVSPTVIGSLRRRRAIVCYLVLYDGRRHPPRSLVCQMEWSGVEWSGVVPASGKVHAQLSTARHIDVVQQRSLALHGQSDRSIDSFIHSFIHSFMYPSMLSYDQDESASPIPTNKAQDRNRQLARDMLFQLLTRSWLSMIISITVTTWSRAPSSRLDVVVDSVSNFSWHPRQCSLSSTRTNTKREQDQECDDGEPLELQSVLASLHIHSFIHSFIVSFWFLVS